jgi:uncharacterized membrane protein
MSEKSQREKSITEKERTAKGRSQRLQVQRDHLASYTRRPEAKGLDDLEHPAMLVGGGALAYWGLRHWRSMLGLMVAGVGGGLIYQGLKQNNLLDGGGNLKQMLLNTGASKSTSVRATITVDRPVEEVYSAWRDLSSLSNCMQHIDRVERIDDTHFRWSAKVPKADFDIEWEAEIIDERQNELLAWRSVEGSELHNEGTVEFRKRPNADGTEVHAHIVYYPPAGRVGQRLGKFLKGINEQMIREDLRRFKHMVETGEIPTIEGQTSGRIPYEGRGAKPRRRIR